MRTICPFCHRTHFRGERLRDFRFTLQALGYTVLKYAHSTCIIDAVRRGQSGAVKLSDVEKQLELKGILQ